VIRVCRLSLCFSVLERDTMVPVDALVQDSSDAAGVLEGDLDELMQAYLRSQVGQDAA
jgi:hypothetical protein